MSLEQTAFVENSRVPQRAALQSAVDALGFDCKIDNSYVPFQFRGYLPCLLNGRASGFEIYFESTSEVLRDTPHLAETVSGRDTAVTFRWGSDMTECAAVLIVSAALARDFGAVVHYREDDVLYSAEQLVEEAQMALQQP